MIKGREGELYKGCFDQLAEFEKNRAGTDGKAFEVAMRKAFEEITNARVDE